MADPNSADRATLYLGRAQQGVVFGRRFSFYPGAATVPNSFTGNQALGASTNGPGAFLINGIGPGLLPPELCEQPIVVLENVAFGDDNVFVSIDMSNISMDDTFILFNENGDAFKASNVSPSGDDWVLTFPDSSVLPPGTYALKVIREGNLDCFGIEYGVFTIAGAVCAIDAEAWTSPGGVPFPPSFLPMPVPTEIAGSGFTSCTIDVTVQLLFGIGPPTLPVIGLTVVNDNEISFTVDGTGVTNAFYEALVFCTDIVGCEDLANNSIPFQDA